MLMWLLCGRWEVGVELHCAGRGNKLKHLLVNQLCRVNGERDQSTDKHQEGGREGGRERGR